MPDVSIYFTHHNVHVDRLSGVNFIHKKLIVGKNRLGMFKMVELQSTLYVDTALVFENGLQGFVGHRPIKKQEIMLVSTFYHTNYSVMYNFVCIISKPLQYVITLITKDCPQYVGHHDKLRNMTARHRQGPVKDIVS